MSAVEFADARALEMARSHQGAPAPLPDSDCPFFVLIETSGSDATHDSEKLEAFLAAALEEDGGAGGDLGGGGRGGALVMDGVLAADLGQANALWQLREGVGPACSAMGLVYKYDVSLPLPVMYELIEVVRERLDGHPSGAIAVGYGHLGDANIHLNVTVSQAGKESCR